jgi:hypothetical protein
LAHPKLERQYLLERVSFEVVQDEQQLIGHRAQDWLASGPGSALAILLWYGGLCNLCLPGSLERNQELFELGMRQTGHRQQQIGVVLNLVVTEDDVFSFA